jgi:hypothetical protein
VTVADGSQRLARVVGTVPIDYPWLSALKAAAAALGSE